MNKHILPMNFGGLLTEDISREELCHKPSVIIIHKHPILFYAFKNCAS
jgi:hypothetical protein